MKQKNIKVNNVEVENKQITIEKVELNEFDIKKELMKSVMDTEQNPDIAFETIRFIIEAEIVHK